MRLYNADAAKSHRRKFAKPRNEKKEEACDYMFSEPDEGRRGMSRGRDAAFLHSLLICIDCFFISDSKECVLFSYSVLLLLFFLLHI